MKRFRNTVEKTLVALVIALLFTPLVASLPQAPTAFTALRRGETPATPGTGSWPPRAWTALEKFKRDFSDQVNTGFFGRKFLIRWTNEIWLRVFHLCAAKSANITVGKDNSLFENGYLREYCLTRVTPAELEPLVADIKRMQDVCSRLNIAFVLMVTPSKASTCPEAITSEWLERYDPRPRAYDYFIPLLKQNSIRFIDGHTLALQAKAKAPAPIFPKGGIHWGQYAASLTTDALIEELKAQGKPVAPLNYGPIQVATKPGKEEGDLYKLMQLAVRWQYPIAQMEIKPNPPKEGDRPSMAVIGGSFMWRVLQQLGASQQFSEIDGYFYYKLFKACNPNIGKKDDLGIVREPTGKMDFAREIYGADCLVLEINEAIIPDARHLKVFLTDALSHVPKDGERSAFLYESYQPYQWGKALSFRASDQPQWKGSSLTGFSSFEGTSTWTNETTATIRLALPPAAHDLLVKAQLGAFLHPQKLPKQNVRIFANDFPAGEWQFSDSANGSREITVRKEWLGAGGRLVLRFEIDHPTSPMSLHMGADERALGLKFESIRINERPTLREL